MKRDQAIEHATNTTLLVSLKILRVLYRELRKENFTLMDMGDLLQITRVHALATGTLGMVMRGEKLQAEVERLRGLFEGRELDFNAPVGEQMRQYLSEIYQDKEEGMEHENRDQTDPD